MSFFRDLLEFAKNPVGAEDENSPYVLFAHKSRALLEEWFGAPRDPGVRFEVVIDTISCMSYDPIRRKYLLFICNQSEHERMLASVAHEMYHRITSNRKRGKAHKSNWVDEVLAFHSSQMVLRRLGYGDFADHKIREMHQSPHRLTIHELWRADPSTPWLQRPAYPDHFAETVAIIGESLEQTVGWERMCEIPQYVTFGAWQATLSETKRQAVMSIVSGIS